MAEVKEREVRAGVYQHYKGNYYQLVGVAAHSETQEWMVVYVPCYVREGPRMNVRPYSMFFEDVEYEGKTVPRFRYIGIEIPGLATPS
jgi:hypothetical protein